LGLRPYGDCLFADIGDVPAVEELTLSCQPGRFATAKMCFWLLLSACGGGPCHRLGAS
jgi:hypothetical protein